MASLVGDLGGEEDLHLLGRRRAHHRPELLGHLLLADEERGQPVHPLEALLLRESLPVLAVLREVEVLREPLLALPQLVELPVVEQLGLAAVGRFLQGRVGGLAEEVAQFDAARERAQSASSCRTPATIDDVLRNDA